MNPEIQLRLYQQYIRFQQAGTAFTAKQREIQALQEQSEHLARDMVIHEAKFRGALEAMGHTTFRFDPDTRTLHIDDEKINSESQAVESAPNGSV